MTTDGQIRPDPLWYKDAIIYQLHVKSYSDANGDGVGDFAGLIEKLDYIASLGVNTIWLLPFYPSPRLDDGYDIADYRGVHPDYGTMRDAKRFIAEAHRRGLRVITELVINHTSDQHPWFQRARRAKPGSLHRNYYVWSDTDQKYLDTRIIFIDTERSNWTWDPVAGAYFWHRFYAHQPDLNFDNPHVLEAVLGVMRYWLDIGVDGLRLDAVPYLVEREGTNNENLPETHAILKRIRAELDATYPDRMLLAEANQWPEDTSIYFGDGDECHMAFHFPLMPRMYMAIAREDRFPITDILRQTPAIPPNCQWAIFLRNHDELTLEMVTDSERDYLWETYASDRRARLNLGIRRRLAPLLERDRRRIELMNFLLLSMPGTPVVYYGDEIGMGDNIHLGDRNGVRTPMQWSPDRNGGFSRADPAALVLPPIMDPLYGFEAVNVEAQSRDPYSLLNWMRRMLNVRGQNPAFGRGTLRFLYPKNRKVIAYLREYEDQVVLCVASVSRTPQAVELDLSEFDGRVPVELDGGEPFPPIGQLTYLLTLPPFGFYWFKLETESKSPTWHTPAPEPMPEYQTLVLSRSDLATVIGGPARATLEKEVLPAYLARRRWFAATRRDGLAVSIAALAKLPSETREPVMAEIEATTKDGTTSRWNLPLSILWDDEPQAALPNQLALARVRRGRRVGVLTDAFALPSFAQAGLAAMAQAAVIETPAGTIRFLPNPTAPLPPIAADAPITWLSAEQSNSSLIVDEQVMVKIIRRIAPGRHPEAEMSLYLTQAGFDHVPAFLGEVVRTDAAGETATLGIVQAFVRNQGDAWTWTLDYLKRALDAHSGAVADQEALDDYIAFAGTLGRRLGAMHAVLAQPSEDPDFAPEGATTADAEGWVAAIDAALERLPEVAKTAAAADLAAETALAAVVDRRTALVKRLAAIAATAVGAPLTRIHGDLHLGQILVTGVDVQIIDFEGEPARPLAERRAKASPYRDVAGMLRSFDYAAAMVEKSPPGGRQIQPEAAAAVLATFRDTAGDAFVSGYFEARGSAATPQELALIDFFQIDKAVYEVGYEAANRPSWIGVPLAGLAALAERVTSSAAGRGR